MIRQLSSLDVARCMELSIAAGWNQTLADWQRLLALDPGGCFGLECDGQLVATTTLLCYGRDLAWIGMVLTDRDYQRRGFARLLMEAALALAERRGVRSVKLDATDQGRPLYESLGFVDEQAVERWQAGSVASGSTSVPLGDFPASLDLHAFGVDRTRFLSLLGEPLSLPGGYVTTRNGTRASYIGPCVAQDADCARTLVASALREGSWFWDLLPQNKAAAALAREFGFTPVRKLTRMVRGAQIRRDDFQVYAIGGFEAG